MDTGGCIWRWRAPWKVLDPGLNWQSGVVDSITMGLTFDLTVREIIDKFGAPEAVSVGGGGQPENWYWIIHFYYPDQAIEFMAYTTEFSKYIKPTSEVGAVGLFSPMTLEERINEISEGLRTPIPTVDWVGYGNVAELYGGGRLWP
jgi:hypothetical protein